MRSWFLLDMMVLLWAHPLTGSVSCFKSKIPFDCCCELFGILEEHCRTAWRILQAGHQIIPVQCEPWHGWITTGQVTYINIPCPMCSNTRLGTVPTITLQIFTECLQPIVPIESHIININIYIYMCVCGPSEETLNLYLCRGAELFDATLSNEAMHQRGKGGLINHLYLLHGHGLRVETSFCSVFLFSASCWFTIMTGNILLHCGTTCVLFC